MIPKKTMMPENMEPNEPMKMAESKEPNEPMMKPNAMMAMPLKKKKKKGVTSIDDLKALAKAASTKKGY